jgi:DNA (cytosine-5)-methyltransferase 1
VERAETVHPVAELFCGAGGMALGFKRARVCGPDGVQHRFAIVWANDADHWACETYRRNIGAHVIEGPVEKLDFRSLPDVEGLLFGFPCNDFSVVGDRLGLSGYFGGLYVHAVRCIEEKKPLWFAAENVPGLRSAKGKKGTALSAVLEDLSKVGRGYELTAHLFRFEDYGVPQIRHRIIIVGFRRDTGLAFRVPAPTHLGRPVTVEEALAGVEQVPHNNEKPRHSARVVELLKHIPEGANCWHPAVPDALRLNVDRCRISLIYRRLARNAPAYTVTGNGGGGTHMYHYEEARALTNREKARLQTFPDDYIFFGPKEAVRSQIGGAVPPLAAQAIAEAILKTVAGVPYPDVQASICEPPRLQLKLEPAASPCG